MITEKKKKRQTEKKEEQWMKNIFLVIGKKPRKKGQMYGFLDQ